MHGSVTALLFVSVLLSVNDRMAIAVVLIVEIAWVYRRWASTVGPANFAPQTQQQHAV